MEPESSPAGPRRSQRDKKQSKPVTTLTAIPESRKKRKRDGTNDENEGEATDTGDHADDDEDGMDDQGADEDDEDEEATPKSRKKKSKKAKADGPPPKKPRKGATENSKTAATGDTARKTRKPRAPKQVANADAIFDPETFEKLTNIKADNPLFNAIMNPNSALLGTSQDFLESLQQSEDAALAELVNMILRCCGCNDTIDGDTAVDYDGVSDRLDDIVEELKKTTTPAGTYPLTSKTASFHNTKIKFHFRNQLSEFISRLIMSAAESGALYDSPLMVALQTWLVPMSSSQIRSIRHTATVIALEVESALCQVGKDVEKEAEVFGRMREGEKKRARTGTTPSTKGKEKELDGKQRDVKARQGKIEVFLKDVINGVFVHRYRDLDPVIRTECVTSLSTFFATLPSHFASSSEYLRYVGWVLSDSAAQVRLAAIKALQTVYETAGIGLDRRPGKKSKPSAKDSGGVSLSALTQFSTRFLPRLLEIARFDIDVGVRVAVMSVLDCVDELGLLSDSDRNRLGTMVYSDEARVRKGVGKFVGGVWEEWVENKLGEIEVESHAQIAASNRGGRGRGRGRGGRGGASSSPRKGKDTEEVDENKLGIKGLVSLLVKWGRTLDRERNRKGKGKEGEDDSEDDEDDDDDARREKDDTDSNATREHGGVATTVATATAVLPVKKGADTAGSSRTPDSAKGRTALAVEAIWDEVDIVRDWEGILDMLVLDHSASGSDSGTGSKSKASAAKGRSKRQTTKSKGKGGDNGNADDDDEDEEDDTDIQPVHDAWRLSEGEEGVLLEMLVASIRRSKKEDEESAENITQALIQALPTLFIKYQTDEHRIADVLTLPMLMNLEVYIEMRETSSYTSLWSDISKQFLTHTSPFVLTAAVHSMLYLLSYTSLSNVNSEQILQLEDELASSLREAVSAPPSPPGSPSKIVSTSTARRGRDIEVATFSEDEIITLTSVILRIRMLISNRDLTAWIEEKEGGKQNSAWDILSAISERGRMGIGGEEEMIEQALQTLTLHLIWKSRILNATTEPTPEEQTFREAFLIQRESLLERLSDFAVGTHDVGNGVSDSVKRTAFKSLVDVHVLFASAETEEDPTALTMADEVQFRCAGYVQAEIERYSESLEEDDEPEAGDESSDEDSGGEDAEDGGEKPKKKSRKPRVLLDSTDEDEISRSQLEQEYLFIDVISTFLRAIRSGTIHVRHGATLLAYYGQLGAAYDACVKVAIEALKEEGLMNEQGDAVVLVITQAMKESFKLEASSRFPDETNIVALAKALASCFVIRGTQLAIIRRLDAQYVVQIQTTLLSWIASELGKHLRTNDKKTLKTWLLFFRALIPLVSSVETRDALRVKAHLDQVFAQHKVEPGTTKAWDPLRAYEKRLGTVMGKDKPAGIGKRRKKTKAAGAASGTDGEESEVERMFDEDDGAVSDGPVHEPERPRPRPRPQRAARARARQNMEAQERAANESDHDEPVTPKARPKPKRASSAKKNPAPQPEAEPEEASDAIIPGNETVPSSDQPNPLSPPSQNGFATPARTPSNRRKRVRDGEDEDMNEETSSQIGEEQPQPEPTPAAFQVKRKRLRRD